MMSVDEEESFFIYYFADERAFRWSGEPEGKILWTEDGVGLRVDEIKVDGECLL